MGSGDIVVGKNSRAGKSTSEASENLVQDTGASAISGNAERDCGAMSQQRGDSGTLSTPQKFVRLVGCRDPKARPSGSR